MRLLVGTRIYQALNSIRRATTPPVAKKRTPKLSNKTADVVAAPAASSTLTSKSRIKPRLHELQLQQLWELNKEAKEGVKSLVKREVQELKDGGLKVSSEWEESIVKRLRESLEFASIEKLLKVDSRFKLEEGKIPNVKLVTEMLWAAVLSKSLGSPAPSIVDWIDDAVLRLPEPIPKQKELMIWLLSILRDDLPMLQRLQQESSRESGGTGPMREKTMRLAALAFLEVGKTDEFRSLWTSSGTHLLAEEIQLDLQQPAALLHHALLRYSSCGKKDPAMLRWYAESLVSYQRTPIPAEPQFETMMLPVIRALGGNIEKWKDNDWRIQKLRKWRDDYDDAELDKVVHLMLEHVLANVVHEEYGTRDELTRLVNMLGQIIGEERQGTTVVVDWLNFACKSKTNIDKLLPSCSLIVVGREYPKPHPHYPLSPKADERVKVIDLPPKREMKEPSDHICVLLTVATRGHLLTNKMKGYDWDFRNYVKTESGDLNPSTLLKNYLKDAVLRHDYHTDKIQPAVDHSKAAQWIDKEKKELAFTVARRIPNIDHASLYRKIEYYSLRID